MLLKKKKKVGLCPAYKEYMAYKRQLALEGTEIGRAYIRKSMDITYAQINWSRVPADLWPEEYKIKQPNKWDQDEDDEV
jgi:hypothetical protein